MGGGDPFAGRRGQGGRRDPDALAASLVDALRDGARPSFFDLYDSVYVAVRCAGDQRAYADAVRAAAARALADADPADGCRVARMMAGVLAPVRHALGLGDEAFVAALVGKPVPPPPPVAS
jgi:hypothetical protein